MDIEFLGGASEIGASCALVTAGSTRLLVDCGVRFEAHNPLPDLAAIGDGRVDAVLVTHAHSDHTGGLPVIVDSLPGVAVHATPPTIDLAKILIRDALKLMDMDEERSRLYTPEQAERLVEAMVPVQQGGSVTVGDVTATFLPASHILGAAMIHLATPAGSVVFTGDFSVSAQLTVPALPTPALEADVVVCESTYGDRMHEDRGAAENRLVSAIAGIVRDGGRVLVPAFAVGRAQEVLLILARALRKGELPEVPVWVDGMVRPVCDVYRRHERYVTRQLAHAIRNESHPFYRSGIRPVARPSDRRLVMESGPCIIVASSGMLHGGASAYYAGQIAGNEQDAILVTGYQDEESPGRALLDLARGQGDGTLKLGTRRVEASCRVESYGLSAHADRMQLAGVIAAFRPSTVVLVHGDDAARESLAGAVTSRDVVLPREGDVVSRGFGPGKRGRVAPTRAEIEFDEARRLLGPPTGVPLRARALAEIWRGPGATRGDAEALVERLVDLGLARRHDERPGWLHVLAPGETDALADEAQLEQELKSQNPKGRLLERCMQMRIEPPEMTIGTEGGMHVASGGLVLGGVRLEAGPARAAAKKTAEQLVCRELLAMLDDASTSDVDEDRPATTAKDPRMLLNELKQKQVISDFGYEVGAGSGPAHMPVFEVTGHVRLAGGRVIQTDTVLAASKKAGQAEAAEAMIDLLRQERLVE